MSLESKITPDSRAALNTLLVYSCSKSVPFTFENYESIFTELVKYMHNLLKLLKDSPLFSNIINNFHPFSDNGLSLTNIS